MSRTQRTVGFLLVLILPILAACGGGGGGSSTASGSAAGGSASALASGANSTNSASPVASTSSSASASIAASASPSASASASSSESSASASTSTGASASTNGTASETETAGTTETAGAGGSTGVAALDFSKIQPENGAALRVSTWGDAAEAAVYQAAFQRFNKVFPNVKINYDPRPEQYQTTIQGDFAAGSAPDVLYVDGSLYRQLAPSNQLMDLKPYMDQVGVSTDSFVSSLANLFISNGKVYGIAKDSNALGLFVNNRLAQEAGIAPASIKTWDDWKNAAQKMTKNGKFGQCGSNDINRIGALMLQKGITPVTTDGKVNVADPKAKEALDFWYGLQKDKFAELPKNIGADWCGVAFGQEQTAMAMEGGWLFPTMQKDYAKIKYTVVPLPTPTDGKPGNLLFTNAWGVAANTKYPKAAAALALYLTSPENQKAILETGFALPTITNLLNDPYFQNNPNSKVIAQAAQYGTPAAQAFGGFNKQDDVIKAINTAFEGLFLGSSSDTQATLQQAAKDSQTAVGSK